MITIRPYSATDQPAWDQYVENHPQGMLYHLSGWKNVIEKTYGHKTYYLMAVNSSKLKAQNPATSNQQPATSNQQRATHYELSAISYELNIVGILPLVHLKHFLFGNALISLPFFDFAGILADNQEAEKALLSEAIQLGQRLKVHNIELRHIKPLSCINESSKLKAQSPPPFPISHELSTMSYVTKSHKVRMLLALPDSSEKLMKSFKSKLRSQIKKPIKEGLKSQIGGLELLDNFYDVFSKNMRDLGSPVHSKQLMKNVIEAFPDKAKIVIIYKENKPIACSLIVGFKHILENPWASALRKYSRHSPNMLLYWTMIEYACDNGYSLFDFGRSSPDEGTYKFKKQWGAQPESLYWQYISLNDCVLGEETPEKSGLAIAIEYWKKLPVRVTRLVGPSIRKHIGL